MEEGGGETSTFPFEDWRYRYLEGIGQEVIIEFVDTCMCGDFHMTLDRSEKDALKYTPNAGLTLYEQMGMIEQGEPIQWWMAWSNLAPGPIEFRARPQRVRPAGAVRQVASAAAGQIQGSGRNRQHQAHYQPDAFRRAHRFCEGYRRHSAGADYRPDEVSRHYLCQQGWSAARYGKYFLPREHADRTRGADFEEPAQVDVPAELLPRTAENSSVYWKALPLRPGRYKVEIAVKDVNGDRKGLWSRGIVVPEYSDDKLSTSSLIVADVMEPVPTKDVSTGQFVIGLNKVRPRVAPADGKPALFKKTRDQKVNFWMQVYNLGVDEKTHKPSATFEYRYRQHRDQQTGGPENGIHRHDGECGRAGDAAEIDCLGEFAAGHVSHRN